MVVRYAVVLSLVISSALVTPARARQSETPTPEELVARAEVTREERAEILAVVDRFDRAFAETLDVEPLLETEFVPEPFSSPDAIAFAALGSEFDEALLGDAARRRRFILAVTNAALLADRHCLSTCDLSSADLPDEHPYTDSVTRSWARSERALGAIEKARSREDFVRRVDRVLTALDALVVALRETLPAGDAMRDANLRWLDEKGEVVVRRRTIDRDTPPSWREAFWVYRRAIFYSVVRTDAGLAVAFVGPATD